LDRLTQALKDTFGYDSFRSGQRPVIDALLSGRDALGVMPTGAGKSVCYQLPALVLGGITLVVSPLISLMRDQVGALLQMGVPAAYLNSSLSEGQFKKALQNAREGKYRIIYVAPERLLTRGFLQFALEADIRLVAVDEAHCVSQWGQDFRPSYLDIARFVDQLGARPPVCALTATATQRVREDIRSLLQLRDPFELVTGFDRPNLFYEVLRPKNKQLALMALLKEMPDSCGIVYCATRRAVDETQALLLANGVPAGRYHAGLSAEERQTNQEDFLFDRTRVMVATNAFGMGIDKSNVRFVIHYNMPKDMESYYQEAGRGGRDGEKCRCVLLFSPKDVQIGRFLIERGQSETEMSEEQKQQHRQAELMRLKEMESYCLEKNCLRKRLLAYFGEGMQADACGACGNCASDLPLTDISAEATHILGLAHVSGQKYGQALLTQLLQGLTSRRIQESHLDRLPGYGALRHLSQDEVRERIEQLLSQGLLEKTAGSYPVLRLTEAGKDYLRRSVPLRVPLRTASDQPAAPMPKKLPAQGPVDDELFARLRALRAELAALQGVPAFVVFTDATLRDMCRRRPRDMDEMLLVSGVGLRKLAQYGQKFLRVLQDYEKEREGI